jgi:putative endonuclease
VAGDARRALGTDGEAAVARWYASAGYAVIDRNWRCREGELDLVLARDDVVVFCEVKTRTSFAFGASVEAVTWSKQRRLRRLARRWLVEHPARRPRDVRFDVASVIAARDAEPAIEVVEAAF